MKVLIKGKSIRVYSTLKDHIERKLHYALGRFGQVIQTVSVQLSDENGPKGGHDKKCRIIVTIPKMEKSVIDEIGDEFQVVVDRAAERASRLVKRTLQKRQDFYHQPTPLLRWKEAPLS